MTFEEWWEKEVDVWDTDIKVIAEEAWQQGYNKGYSVGFDESEAVFEAGVQEGIQQTSGGVGWHLRTKERQ